MIGARPYRVLLRAARAVLAWERLWPLLWPVVGVVALFVSLALLDVFAWIPAWLHLAVLLLAGAAFAGTAARALRRFRPAGEAEARRRLEADSGLAHRPLSALEDHLASGAGDESTRALWQAHLLRAAASVRHLRLRPPAPGMAARDPHGFRAGVLLLLVVAVVAGWGDASARLQRALVPKFQPAPGHPVAAEVWITPPAYTAKPPVYLSLARRAADGADGTAVPQAVEVPAGSTLLAQVTGLAQAPVLVTEGAPVPFESLAADGDGAAGGYRLETELTGGDRLSIRDGAGEGAAEVAGWPLTVRPDAVPEVVFIGPPKDDGQGRLRLEYQARDDYGVVKLESHAERADGPPPPGVPADFALDLPLRDPGAPEARGVTLRDLTAHPWAGLPVRLWLSATDAKGQEGRSEAAELILPERTFNHPVAREIVAARKRLAVRGSDDLERVLEDLDAIVARPDRYAEDTVVFLGLRVARYRLYHEFREHGDAQIPSVMSLLWDLALRLENGEVALAEQDLRRAEEALAKALQENAPSDEIERLMNELRDAMDKYFRALAEQMQRQDMPEGMMDPNAQVMTSDDLKQMLDRAQELARTGSREAAKQLLEELRKRLESLRAGRPTQLPRKALNEMRKMMDAMRDLIQRQQKLMDQTFRRSQQGGPGQRDPRSGQQGQMGEQGQQGEGQAGEGSQGAMSQEELRRRLGEMMLRMDEMFGGIPKSMGQADRNMRDATQSLRGDRPGEAAGHQGEALENLRGAMEGMAEQMARSMGQGMPMGMGQPQGQRDMRGRDPFGRTSGGHFGNAEDGSVKVPDAADLRRAGEILRELRRRAGQHQRPRPERDYIDRLLRRF
ncbi:MAG: TIGR02302 family protein [Hyphomicrobiales bacterium]|nr:TIGR02302 family protein [Hyphomicrobiales bacterium]MCP5371047.1 TIGR02302 family protein [Hyphomicrobiales bacterium]